MVAVTDRGLCGLWFPGTGGREKALREMKTEWPRADWKEDRVSSGRIVKKIFSSAEGREVKVFLKGTPFQVKVWEALLRIPEGCVVSYGDLAKRIGEPKASRAVGSAVGSNPISYLIPCHRVIRETGVLGEYRWGPARKKAMLAKEGPELG